MKLFFFLLFDTIQLAVLLFLTGGIYNPFSLLLIAPIVISASYLRMVFSIILSFLSILIVAFISIFYVEIDWPSKFVIPDLFTYGLILSLIISFIFITIYVYIFANSSRKISEALNRTSAALANQKKLSEVGSLSAAAVHELSTPLNTIFLILDDLKKDKAFEKNSEIMKEIDLLKSQAQRCKQILLRLSKNPQNLKDEFFNQTTISNIIDTNFEKFKNSNINMKINISSNENEPKIKYMDELMYGIGNIVQNAIQHAKKNITVNISWNKEFINIFIFDDGKGFAKEILDQIGNPYISKNKDNGMGLGIFIAKNLIENIGGKIFFNNNIDNISGSKVEIELKRELLR
tara:strand:- start:149 stop:1189 length:1041 start_codon:yes stop_codon:yes gene_type:complete